VLVLHAEFPTPQEWYYEFVAGWVLVWYQYVGRDAVRYVAFAGVQANLL
jgi:hypothetical protein